MEGITFHGTESDDEAPQNQLYRRECYSELNQTKLICPKAKRVASTAPASS